MKPSIVTAALLAASLVACPISLSAAEHESMGANLYPPTKIEWKDGPPSLPQGAKFAVLEGDPSKEGMFVMRIRVPGGYHIPAHTHPKPERVTVIQGTFKLAMGENPKLADAHVLPAGTFGVWPAGMVHAAWTEGETIVQLHGMGPWAINYVNPADDPRNTKKP
jgi:quercetin dioxygenase-like cupin family protein